MKPAGDREHHVFFLGAPWTDRARVLAAMPGIHCDREDAGRGCAARRIAWTLRTGRRVARRGACIGARSEQVVDRIAWRPVCLRPTSVIQKFPQRIVPNRRIEIDHQSMPVGGDWRQGEDVGCDAGFQIEFKSDGARFDRTEARCRQYRVARVHSWQHRGESLWWRGDALHVDDEARWRGLQPLRGL